MNFNLSEEQEMLKTSIEKFIQDNYELSKRIETQKKEHGS